MRPSSWQVEAVVIRSRSHFRGMILTSVAVSVYDCAHVVCNYTCMLKCTCVCDYTCVSIPACSCAPVCVRLYLCVCLYLHVQLHLHVCVCTCPAAVHVSMCKCICVHVYAAITHDRQCSSGCCDVQGMRSRSGSALSLLRASWGPIFWHIRVGCSLTASHTKVQVQVPASPPPIWLPANGPKNAARTGQVCSHTHVRSPDKAPGSFFGPAQPQLLQAFQEWKRGPSAVA